MWVFFNDAFLSIVDNDADPECLLVRARVKGDIERVFLSAEVHVTPVADYRFRASVERSMVAEALAARVRELDYPNFKDSVREDWRHHAYARVWGIMFDLQQQRIGYELLPKRRIGGKAARRRVAR